MGKKEDEMIVVPDKATGAMREAGMGTRAWMQTYEPRAVDKPIPLYGILICRNS